MIISIKAPFGAFFGFYFFTIYICLKTYGLTKKTSLTYINNLLRLLKTLFPVQFINETRKRKNK